MTAGAHAPALPAQRSLPGPPRPGLEGYCSPSNHLAGVDAGPHRAQHSVWLRETDGKKSQRTQPWRCLGPPQLKAAAGILPTWAVPCALSAGPSGRGWLCPPRIHRLFHLPCSPYSSPRPGPTLASDTHGQRFEAERLSQVQPDTGNSTTFVRTSGEGERAFCNVEE